MIACARGIKSSSNLGKLPSHALEQHSQNAFMDCCTKEKGHLKYFELINTLTLSQT